MSHQLRDNEERHQGTILLTVKKEKQKRGRKEEEEEEIYQPRHQKELKQTRNKQTEKGKKKTETETETENKGNEKNGETLCASDSNAENLELWLVISAWILDKSELSSRTWLSI